MPEVVTLRKCYLSRGDTLKMSRSQGRNPDEWVIEDIIGEGSSCVCYSASCNGSFGRLKEFYPINLPFIRNEGKQLVPGLKERYEQLRSEFLNTFEILNSARNRREPEGQALNNYLPVNELLYGEQSVYVWAPNDRMGITLDEYLKKTPLEKRDLQEILQLTLTVADFLRSIHTLSLLHLDIKPSNILVTVNSQGLINPKSITVFDSDSVYNLKDEKSPRCLGTSGFSAPELKNGFVSNKVDIFSLGALMFSALFGRPFTTEDFSLLGQLVARSAVSCDIGVDEQRCLTSILQQALVHYPDFRYRSVILLIRDLEELLDQCRSTLTFAEKFGDIKIAVQNLLYESPLFASENKRVNVAIVGAGNVAQKFIDQALQIAQVPAHSIHIRAFSLNAEKDCENYLCSRPALKDFVRVNGKFEGDECFGELDFLLLPTIEGMAFCRNFEVDRRIAGKILDECGELNYVFIATGDDELNRSVAETFETLTNCPVKFLNHGNVVVNEKLEKMAFNTHLSWLGHLNDLDMAEVKTNFLEKYNHESSLDFALSIRYKLNALGIELTDFDKAAREFKEKLDDETLAALSEAEHSRWLIEKACAGWQAPKTSSGIPDYAHCIACLRSTGKPQDDTHLLHHCLIPFAELDRMSDELHEAVVREAEKFKRSSVWRHHMKELTDIFQDGDDKIRTSFKTFELSLQEIFRGNVNHSRNIKACFKELQATIKLLPEPTKTSAEEHCDVLRKVFLVLAEANLRRDYKANDFILVQKIPFIIAFESPKIIMAFDDGRAGAAEIFGNVASVIVLNPTELTYLYCADPHSDSKLLAQRLKAALEFLTERKVRADVNLVVAVLKGNEFDTTPLQAIEPRLKSLTICEIADTEHAKNFFLERIEKSDALIDGSTKLFPSPFVQSEFIGRVSQKFPYFEFDFLSKKFFWMRHCEFLNYVEDNSFLNVRDLFALYNNEVRALNVLNSESDYCRKFCDLLQFDFAGCRRLITLFSENEKKSEHLAVIFKIADSFEPVQYFLPASVKSKVDFLLRRLAAAKIVTDVDISDSDDTLSVSFRSASNDRFDEILESLSPDCDIEIQTVDTGIKVALKSLATTLVVPADCLTILRRFSESRLLLNVKIDTENRVHFRYASRAIKHLLTSFKDAMKTFFTLSAWLSGRFDDMACDVDFLWGGTQKRFEIVATKGFACFVLQILQGNDIAGLYEFAAQASVVGMRSKKICLIIDGQPDEELANQLGVILYRETDILNFA